MPKPGHGSSWADGAISPGGLSGHFFQPTLLTDVRPDNQGYRERIAGPVLGLTPVEDAQEAAVLAGELRPSHIDLYGSGLNLRVPDVPIARVTAPTARWFPHGSR